MKRSGCVCTSFGLLLIRCVIGAVFIFHGAQKVFGVWGGSGMDKFIETVQGMQIPNAETAAWVAAISEFAGGILLVIGLLTRPAALFLVGTMAVDIVKVHPSAFSMKEGGMEYPLTLGLVAAGLIFTGAGGLSVDGAIRRAIQRERLDPVPLTTPPKP